MGLMVLCFIPDVLRAVHRRSLCVENMLHGSEGACAEIRGPLCVCECTCV